MSSFFEKLETSVRQNNSLVCVGLDPILEKIPAHIRAADQSLLLFSQAIIEATKDLVCTYKINTAFYEAAGSSGVEQMKATVAYVQSVAPDVPVIIDAKRGDIGATNEAYAKYVFEYLLADAITLQPYLGLGALEPFYRHTDKGIIILCRTSNPEAGEVQDILSEGKRVYEIVADHARSLHEQSGNIALVTGATYPAEIGEIRSIVGDGMWLLVPGIGAQGGDLAGTLEKGLNANRAGLMINSSRGIIFASSGEDFAERAREKTLELRDEINRYRS